MERKQLNQEGAFLIPTDQEYRTLIGYAKKVDYSNHLDLVHDAILSTSSIADAKRFISGRKYDYLSVNPINTNDLIITDLVCNKCNQVQPKCAFELDKVKNRFYHRGTCKECRRAYMRINFQVKKDEYKKRRKGFICFKCNVTLADDEIAQIKSPRIKRRRQCSSCKRLAVNRLQKEYRQNEAYRARHALSSAKYRRLNPEKVKESRRKYKLKAKELGKPRYKQSSEKRRLSRERNKESIKAYRKKYNLENAEKVREYNREYLKRYRQNNKEKILENQRKYRLQKAILKSKIISNEV